MRFLHFRFSDLDLWPLELKSALPVTPIQRYVSAKLDVSMAFLFGENQRHGMDGETGVRTRCNT